MIIRNIKEEAVQKITDGTKEVSGGGKEGAVKNAVRDALVNFCRQSEEFSEAVLATGKCMKECISEIIKGVGNSISDFDLYRRAVAFWMEGADVHAEIRIVLPAEGGKSPDVRENATPAPRKVKILSLEELL